VPSQLCIRSQKREQVINSVTTNQWLICRIYDSIVTHVIDQQNGMSHEEPSSCLHSQYGSNHQHQHKDQHQQKQPLNDTQPMDVDNEE
jgi:hypothetical protein